MGQALSRKRSGTASTTANKSGTPGVSSNGDVVKTEVNGSAVQGSGIVDSVQDTQTDGASPRKEKKKRRFIFSLKRSRPGSGRKKKVKKEKSSSQDTSVNSGRSNRSSLFMDEFQIPEDDGIDSVSLSSNEDKEKKKRKDSSGIVRRSKRGSKSSKNGKKGKKKKQKNEKKKEEKSKRKTSKDEGKAEDTAVASDRSLNVNQSVEPLHVSVESAQAEAEAKAVAVPQSVLESENNVVEKKVEKDCSPEITETGKIAEDDLVAAVTAVMDSKVDEDKRGEQTVKDGDRAIIEPVVEATFQEEVIQKCETTVQENAITLEHTATTKSAPSSPANDPVTSSALTVDEDCTPKRVSLGPRLKTAILKKYSGAGDAPPDSQRVTLTKPKVVDVPELVPPPRKNRARALLSKRASKTSNSDVSTNGNVVVTSIQATEVSVDATSNSPNPTETVVECSGNDVQDNDNNVKEPKGEDTVASIMETHCESVVTETHAKSPVETEQATRDIDAILSKDADDSETIAAHTLREVEPVIGNTDPNPECVEDTASSIMETHCENGVTEIHAKSPVEIEQPTRDIDATLSKDADDSETIAAHTLREVEPVIGDTDPNPECVEQSSNSAPDLKDGISRNDEDESTEQEGSTLTLAQHAKVVVEHVLNKTTASFKGSEPIEESKEEVPELASDPTESRKDSDNLEKQENAEQTMAKDGSTINFQSDKDECILKEVEIIVVATKTYDLKTESNDEPEKPEAVVVIERVHVEPYFGKDDKEDRQADVTNGAEDNTTVAVTTESIKKRQKYSKETGEVCKECLCEENTVNVHRVTNIEQTNSKTDSKHSDTDITGRESESCIYKSASGSPEEQGDATGGQREDVDDNDSSTTDSTVVDEDEQSKTLMEDSAHEGPCIYAEEVTVDSEKGFTHQGEVETNVHSETSGKTGDECNDFVKTKMTRETNENTAVPDSEKCGKFVVNVDGDKHAVCNTSEKDSTDNNNCKDAIISSEQLVSVQSPGNCSGVELVQTDNPESTHCPGVV